MTAKIELLSGQRQSGESDKAVQAANDYLRLGPGRSLSALLQKYTEAHQNTPPTKSLNTLKGWSSKFDWSARAAAFDATWDARKTAERKAEMDYGLSLDYERVRKLKRLAAFLEGQIYEQGETGAYHNVWLPDVKWIGSGEHGGRVDIERFNGALIAEYRAVLDDLAKETGGRIKRLDLTMDLKQLQKLEKLAAALGVDLSEVVEGLIRRFEAANGGRGDD